MSLHASRVMNLFKFSNTCFAAAMDAVNIAESNAEVAKQLAALEDISKLVKA